MSIWSTPEVRSELGVYRLEYVSPKYVDLKYARSTFRVGGVWIGVCQSEVCRSGLRPKYELGVYGSEYVSPKYVALSQEYVRSTC